MTANKDILPGPHRWRLGDIPIQAVDKMTVLGVTFSSKLSSSDHIAHRTNACRRNMFGLSSVGMSYPGLCTEAKTHLWRSIGLPTLKYGMECLPLSKGNLKDLEAVQATTLKSCLGLQKRSHHSSLLNSLSIAPVDFTVTQHSINLFKRILSFCSPAFILNNILLSDFISSNKLVQGTLLHRLISYNVSPVRLLTNNFRMKHVFNENDGISDSLRLLIFSDNYVKPWSAEFLLCKLLTSCFT
eukprot:GHVO01065946.1.p1 GENE.GHVO01065946.1~~GHVO01065946.1.p1  ORF type:complete len:281 (-),score=3.66 GHVO01065946.1:1000-1725(-)